MRQKVAEKLSTLLMKAQELGFELATLDDPKLLNHPVVVKARELIKELKELFELQRLAR